MGSSAFWPLMFHPVSSCDSYTQRRTSNIVLVIFVSATALSLGTGSSDAQNNLSGEHILESLSLLDSALLGNFNESRLSGMNLSSVKTTASPNVRKLNDFYESFLNASAEHNVTIEAASTATWRGAGQKLTCTKEPPVEQTLFIANCQVHGCNFQVTFINDSRAEIYFVASSLWNNTAVACVFLRYQWRNDYDAYVMKRHHLWIPIIVRDRPVIKIEPSQADFYPNRSLEVLCRAHSPYVEAEELQLIVLGSVGSRMENLNYTYDETNDATEVRTALQPHQLMLAKSIRCEAFLGAPPDQVYVSATSPVTERAVPKLTIVPAGATLVLGKRVTIACVADGFVIGRLRWTVACSSCIFTEQSWPPNSGGISTSANSATQTITFIASHEWDGITVGCQPGNYDSLAVRTTLVVKNLPSLTISSPELKTYDGQNVTVRCFVSRETPDESNSLLSESLQPNTAQRSTQLLWSVQPTRDAGMPWINDADVEPPGYSLKYRSSMHPSGTSSFINFQSSPFWINQTVGCSLVTGDPADTKGTRVAAAVHVYEPPTISIEPRRPVVEEGSEVTLLCTAYGLVFGGLQWRVVCNACDHRVEHVNSGSGGSGSIVSERYFQPARRLIVSSAEPMKNARLQVVIKPRDIYQSITAECSVSGTGGWPRDAVMISVPDSPVATTIRWIGALLAASVMLSVFVVIRRKLLVYRISKINYLTPTEDPLVDDYRKK